ncbi:TadE/TadG family type IV pilus assembly protein [Methylomicrobium lacus]|uniref:TadE/TadG family type IV pilus assembly protein n=1 Tax=Methylomicrobium lacus TaxID=136992 RepID=UPI000A01807C|nr:TadE/TadG family type IV pilus assembly protein [Methylomicrobium lacus]
MKTQHGAALVEFALIALWFFIILFGIIEFGRAFFTYNTLVEATRRGARVAAVCPISTSGALQAKQVTVFDPNNPDGSSAITGLLGLSTANVQVDYCNGSCPDSTTNWISGPLASSDNTYNNITFVRVQLINLPNFLTLNIPLFQKSLTMPPIQTTLPSQSLGRISYDNPVTQRCCYGICS